MAFPPRAPVVVTWYPTGQPERLPARAELAGLRWATHADNPLIAAPLSGSLREPTFLPPHLTPDGRWLLLARTRRGLAAWTGLDGLRWSALPGLIATDAARPALARDGRGLWLVAETAAGRVEARSSRDGRTWSGPRLLLQPSLPWHGGRVSAPCLIAGELGWRLYYGAGEVAGLTEAVSLDAPLVAEVSPLETAPAGLRALPLQDGLLGLVQRGERLQLWISEDGRRFQAENDLPLPGARPDGGLDARWLDGRLLVYYALAPQGLRRGGLGLMVGS